MLSEILILGSINILGGSRKLGLDRPDSYLDFAFVMASKKGTQHSEETEASMKVSHYICIWLQGRERLNKIVLTERSYIS